MGNKKRKLLEKYLEKKEKQKERDSLVKQLKELQSRTEKDRKVVSSSSLTRKGKILDKTKEKKTKKHIPTVKKGEYSMALRETIEDDGIVWKKAEKREILKEEIAAEETGRAEEKTNKTQTMLKTSKGLSKTRNTSPNLPITHMEDEIVSAVKESSITIITGGTGSGKSTQVPQFLYENGLTEHKKICITQPRRVSTQSVCRRIAQEQESEVGEVCGYRMRYDSKVSSATEIVVVTEGVLLQEMSEDPYLSEYSVIILDEVHERSLCQDTILLVLAKIAAKSPLRLVLMSASVSESYIESIERTAGVSVRRIEVESQQYSVDIHYLQLRQYTYLEEIKKRVEILGKEEGSILAFVATKEETENMKKDLEGTVKDKAVYALHSDTPEDIQQSILNSRNVVIVSTNVAETSITLPDVKYVIDGGREIVKRYRYADNSYTFETNLISKESSDQRKGRTGRVGPGICYRIYTTVEYENMNQNREPEIKRERILPMISALLNAGVTPKRMGRVQCITEPPVEAVHKEIEELKRLSMVDSSDNLTHFGKDVLSLPVDPVLGSALVRALNRSQECLGLMIDIIVRIELYSSRKTAYTPSYTQDTQTYIEVLCRDAPEKHRRKKLTDHIVKSLIKTFSNKIDSIKDKTGSIRDTDREEYIMCGKILASCLSSNMVTFYNGKYYHNGQEIRVRSPLPEISADKPVPIMYYSLVYPNPEETSKVSLISSIIPEI